MASHQTIAIQGPDDRELDIPRTNPLRYHLTLPAGPAGGVVYLIAGFGEDDDTGYASHLRETIADTHQLAVVSVDYHAGHCRLDGGAQLDFQPDDARTFASYVDALGVTVDDDLGLTLRRMQAVLDRLPQKRSLVLTADLVPLSGEHQNFGVVQALDHLAVHADLLKRVAFDRSLVVAFGSSHGAYIGHLMARMAPNTISAVFDNSGYARPALPYFLGREMGSKPVMMLISPGIAIVGYPRTRWTLRPGLPNSYGGDAHRFRDLLDPGHLARQAELGGRRTRYRCLHSSSDLEVAPVGEKQELIAAMRGLGFDAELTVMTDAEVDGRFVKSLDHGMGLSLKTMFARLVASAERNTTDDDFARDSTIDYPGDDRCYRFRFTPDGVDFRIERDPGP